VEAEKETGALKSPGLAGGAPWHAALLALAVGVIATLVGCSRAPESANPGNPANTGAAFPPSLLLSRSTYEAALKPNTRLIDTGTMSRAYRGTSANGELIFDASKAPEVAALSPGTVAIFAGTAILNVQGIRRTGDTVTVTGVRAGLEDAIERGRIAWSANLDFRRMVFNPPPGFHPLEVSRDEAVDFLDAFVGPAEAGVSLANNSWTGKVEGFDVTLKLTPNEGNLTIDLRATKSIAGGTISVHGVGKLNGLTDEGSITLADGSTTEVTFDNKGLSGSVDLDWKVAFDAQLLATGTLTLVQCEKRELSIMGYTGYTPGLLGKLKIKPIPPKLVFKKTYTQIEPPNITLCKN